ncbi:MAG: DNA topoisomerase (ATP-hydrolyzing) subunit A [Bacteroides sp.]|nr:DNA topoisomerase (ATP-hydrolyzing) subunit A [Eubacterium sp.]MCM1418874.1 DNA topoisomerase (ATP-hydrolyzing) subunit A [Roseburia sp.]MCM1463339.1 DNA topoisomerase (ATP-hydrolyzing) subunit A [Bacteroides sp.]
MKKKKTPAAAPSPRRENAYIEGAGIVEQKNIVDTLEENYMPYAMSVIISRALPEIDGFKPSHRKLLYTMYKMGLLTGPRTKSANIVGQTMKLNPHGDQAIYETMVRLARGNETLLHPYVDSKGNFGKAYSRDMAFAASRYTEAKLEPICNELFGDIDKDTVDFVPNYDNNLTEPTLFPVRFPSILINNNIGIAVSMASNICSFNLAEICETTIALMKDPEHDVSTTLRGPDFPGGGYILYDDAEMQKVYRTGRGSIKIRAKYAYDKAENCIEVTEIPPTTTVEAIMDKVIELVKLGKVKEISDMRDETDLSGLKLTFDLKKGIDPDRLMQKLFRLTPLQDSFSCNFNVLIAGNPRVLGVYEILNEWISFRIECVKRMIYFDLGKKREKLHLLLGLQKILLDIDRAIKIIRETKEEAEVVPNLMIGFGIDEIQADYVAEIKLRHINQEYILKRTSEIGDLKSAIADMEETLESPRKIKNIIMKELSEIAEKYGKPRRTKFAEAEEEIAVEEEEQPDYPLNVFLTAEGYFKRVTPQSLRMSGEHKLKEGDRLVFSEELSSRAELLFFTNLHQVYKSRVSDFADTKISTLGDYIPAKLEFEPSERIVKMIPTKDYGENLILFFENGKCAKIPLSSFETKTKRKKLANAYFDGSPLVAMYQISGDAEFVLQSDAGKLLIFSTVLILPKAARDTQGVQVMRLTKAKLESALPYTEGMVKQAEKYFTKTIPAAGAAVKFNLGQLEFE